jgi:hypothetical protein
MLPLTQSMLPKIFVNASRREASQATPPFPLDEVDWENTDLLGWKDPHNPQRIFLILPAPAGSDRDKPVGMLLRVVPSPPRKNMCALCEDITQVSDVRMVVAKLAGPAGRRGDTVGTLVHTDFGCNGYARRQPTRMEGLDNPDLFIANRVTALQSNAEAFALRVLADKA